ncbi:Os12g0229100, partial [Oryza sativa Japonica Group]
NGRRHKLCWLEQTEFVRMAVQFNAIIVPFGSSESLEGKTC